MKGLAVTCFSGNGFYNLLYKSVSCLLCFLHFWEKIKKTHKLIRVNQKKIKKTKLTFMLIKKKHGYLLFTYMINFNKSGK